MTIQSTQTRTSSLAKTKPNYKSPSIQNILKEPLEVWEQGENEPDEAFNAFEIYKNLPFPERTYTNAYKTYVERMGIVGSKRLPDEWKIWTTKYKWSERAEAFDDYFEKQTLLFVEQDQFKDLLAYRRRQRALSAKLSEITLALLIKAQQRLTTLTVDEITPALLPKILQSAGMLAQLASETEASSLMLNDIADAYQEQMADKTTSNQFKPIDDDVEFAIDDDNN